jgi:hypothetical protein
MKTYVGPEPVTFKGPAVRVSIVDTQARTVGSLTPHAGADKIPGVVSRKHGKGRVVYLAAGLDAGYYLYPFPYERLALARSIRWAAGDEPPPVRVEAPMCVHASLMRQSKEGSVRLILHLYSDLNTSAHHALPADDVPLREESVSIHDISVTFHPRYRISRVHLEPEGRDLTRETIPAGTRVVVPRLDIHTMVVAELEAESRGDPMK